MIRLRELRIEKGRNMSEMAKEIGIPYTTYISYEKGEREPNSEMLIKLSRHFGVSIDYLIGRTDIRKPVILEDNGQKEKYEELKRMLDQLTDENAASLKEYSLFLLQRQQSPGDQ